MIARAGLTEILLTEDTAAMIDLEIRGVAFITLNTPATRNALNNELAVRRPSSRPSGGYDE
jgi:enoyl-CoA hydratase/carnithine racemase